MQKENSFFFFNPPKKDKLSGWIRTFSETTKKNMADASGQSQSLNDTNCLNSLFNTTFNMILTNVDIWVCWPLFGQASDVTEQRRKQCRSSFSTTSSD